jgi:multimeric flavodoxin WrbA
LGIVGSYRKHGITDRLVTEVLSSAEQSGALTQKIYLADTHIEFCRNCRHCTQTPGPEPGDCIHDDEMESILAAWNDCDGLVLGAPVNFYNVNALTRRFMERLTCYAYWPWGQAGPAMRSKHRKKPAVLITSTAMPAFLGRVSTGALRALKLTAKAMGARPVKVLFVGLAAQKALAAPSRKAIRRAQSAGRLLAGYRA